MPKRGSLLLGMLARLDIANEREYAFAADNPSRQRAFAIRGANPMHMSVPNEGPGATLAEPPRRPRALDDPDPGVQCGPQQHRRRREHCKHPLRAALRF
jgi:hypothetical protein